MKVDIWLPDDLANFVKAQVAEGRYSSTEAVLVEALHLLEDQAKHDVNKLQDLRAAWIEGLESGDFQEFDLDDLKRTGRERLKAIS